jgi:hypothetical protein
MERRHHEKDDQKIQESVQPRTQAECDLAKLKFGVCRNCGHEVVLEGSTWEHRATRGELYNVPHWPTGHMITQGCRMEGCGCRVPELDETKPTQEKLVYLGRNTTH